MNQDLQIASQETKLIFVRHGEAVGNVTKVFHGFTDSDLTENGKAQAERAAPAKRTDRPHFFKRLKACLRNRTSRGKAARAGGYC